MSKDPIVVDVDYYGEDEIRQLLARKQSLIDYAATAADEIERLREELSQARRERDEARAALEQTPKLYRAIIDALKETSFAWALGGRPIVELVGTHGPAHRRLRDIVASMEPGFSDTAALEVKP